ncbi:ComF family protein [Balneatrix alpica]|uniref:ComF family protein n=1 Tax=Balneatrix alpica TaxID=75684 RepID=A0ABV5ZB92_9GAMM|nr:ComF family protein [Balneatrix alpica]
MQWKQVYNRSKNILTKSSCPLCGLHHGTPLCSGCLEDLPWNGHSCRSCALPLPRGEQLCGQCLQQPWPFQLSWCGFRYELPLAQLISRFKYQADFHAGKLLVQLLLTAWPHSQPKPAVLLPVPMHTERLRQRGFNHSQWLATQLGQAWQIPVLSDRLQRQRLTPTQQGLSARQRRRNLQQAFLLEGSLPDLPIALVDDVLTTGATAHALARLIHSKQSHANLQLYCLARTPAPAIPA